MGRAAAVAVYKIIAKRDLTPVNEAWDLLRMLTRDKAEKVR